MEQAKHVVLAITINERTAYNASLASASSGDVSYPNGNVGGVSLDILALGADKTVQEFHQNPNNISEKINAYTFNGWLYDNKLTPSCFLWPAYRLRCLQLSLITCVEGYGKGRVIEPITAFSTKKAVQLLDISIGIASEGSPFNFTTKEKLISTGQSSIWPDPLAPYLYLPRQACDNLASVLPISFDEDLKYHLWHTKDPDFAKIVSSPSCLGFVFPPTVGAAHNVVIKVPFALLNLTLEAPVTDTPKQYFPCVPTKFENKLGRAFIQAAFIGRNWNTKTSWLAQAPGPGPARQGLGEGQHVDIANDATMIKGFDGEDMFLNSWKGQWSLLESQGGGGNGSQPGGDRNTSASSGLSTGAKAGIGVGAVLGAFALLAAFIFWWKSSTRNKASQPHVHDAGIQHIEYDEYEKKCTNHGVHEVPNSWNDNEPMVELPGIRQYPAELGDTTVQSSRY